MKRKIIEIDSNKCNGCSLCVKACHEGAIEIYDGKARLISDSYCDGLGNCLPECPTDAIRIIEREAAEFDEECVNKRMEDLKSKEEPENHIEKTMACGCPGTMAKLIQRQEKTEITKTDNSPSIGIVSELRQWPVQLCLVNPMASFLKDANLLIAADCTAYAYGSFHKDFIKDRITLIGCPKLDDNNHYLEKLSIIFGKNTPKSITVVRMEVPCCAGIVNAVKQAMLNAKIIVPYNEVTISTDGRVVTN